MRMLVAITTALVPIADVSQSAWSHLKIPSPRPLLILCRNVPWRMRLSLFFFVCAIATNGPVQLNQVNLLYEKLFAEGTEIIFSDGL